MLPSKQSHWVPLQIMEPGAWPVDAGWEASAQVSCCGAGLVQGGAGGLVLRLLEELRAFCRPQSPAVCWLLTQSASPEPAA